jgi:hypothetical protein
VLKMVSKELVEDTARSLGASARFGDDKGRFGISRVWSSTQRLRSISRGFRGVLCSAACNCASIKKAPGLARGFSTGANDNTCARWL